MGKQIENVYKKEKELFDQWSVEYKNLKKQMEDGIIPDDKKLLDDIICAQDQAQTFMAVLYSCFSKEITIHVDDVTKKLHKAILMMFEIKYGGREDFLYKLLAYWRHCKSKLDDQYQAKKEDKRYESTAKLFYDTVCTMFDFLDILEDNFPM